MYGTPTPEFTFQSTLPREERQITDTLICNLRWYFNPRSHERSDLTDCTFFVHQKFQSTLPREERLLYVANCYNDITFQSTLPREERQYGMWLEDSKKFISIHAPTRGATIYRVHQASKGYISIHAPTRGATINCEKIWRFLVQFQSTLPREERLLLLSAKKQALRNFNPRSHERSDSNIAQKICLFLYNTDNKYIIR